MLNLEAIKERLADGSYGPYCGEDISALLSEVEHLRARCKQRDDVAILYMNRATDAEKVAAKAKAELKAIKDAAQ